MKVKKIVEALSLTVAAGRKGLDEEVTGGYIADLLSCAMAGAEKGNVWITLQGHLNVVAVASLNELAAVIVAEGKPVSPETLTKADEEGVVILTTGLAGYQIAGQLWELGHTLTADLHVHTVLSPCAEVEMIPPLIVRRAIELGLRLIGITDHNAAANCAAVVEAAAGSGVAVLPGMELQTAEEVHLLCLFDTVEQALTWQGIVFDHLPDQHNPEDVLGAQYVVDATGDYLRTEARLLLTSTDLTLEEAVRRVRGLGGLALPAHVDRPSFSLLANLGLVPPGLDVPALEIFRATDPAELRRARPDLAAWPLIKNGDAHRLNEIAARLTLDVDAPTVAEVTRALARLR